MPSVIAYLGPQGTFTEAALRRLPQAASAQLRPLRSVPEAMDEVRSRACAGALVPIENSVEGSVPVTLDSLVRDTPLVITAEVVLPVSFVLAGRTGTPVTTIASHPHALAQCRRFLHDKHPDATTVEALSTAAAAAEVAAGRVDACVCARLAAERHGLDILAEDIGDNPGAVTRFGFVSRPVPAPAPTGNDLTSLAVYIAHDKIGALLSVLTELEVRGINLTRIESRPTGERLGRYAFFLDCTGHIATARMGEALMGLRRVCAEVRYLGSYPRDTGEPAIPAPTGLSDGDFTDARDWLERLRGSGSAVTS